MSRLHFNVAGEHGSDVPLLEADSGWQDIGQFEGSNRMTVSVPSTVTGGATLYYQSRQKWFRVIVPPGDGDWEAGLPPCLPPEYGGDSEKVALIYAPIYVPLPALIRRGNFFGLETGDYFTAIDRSDFRLLHIALTEGLDACKPIFQQRKDYGYNMARVFGTCHFMFRLYPSEWPNYYDVLESLKQLASGYGCYLNFVATADAPTSIPTVKAQLEHWEQCAKVLTGHLLSAGNELDQPVNRLESLPLLTKQLGVLCSRGSNGGAADVPPRPWMDWEELHTNAQSEWWRKSHNTWELSVGNKTTEASHVPAMTTETPRAADQDGNAQHHRDDGEVAALLPAGKTFHSESGKYSRLWDGQEAVCAKASADGSRSVPLEFQDGHYNRPVDPQYLRVYQRILPTGRAHTVNVEY